MSGRKQVRDSDGEFYMTRWKWNERYYIGGKVKNQTKILEEMGWIESRIKVFTPESRRELFRINDKKLFEIYSKMKDKDYTEQESVDETMDGGTSE